MSQNQAITIEKQLQQIADMLIVNGLFTDCPGLIHGKTGIAIFFFHYSKYADNEVYIEYAIDLITEIQKQLHNNSPADYKTGLAGIGAGMDYLFKNQFLCSDDDILEDFDERMYRAVMYDPCPDFSLYNGLTGYGRYWMIRLNRRTSSVKARQCLLRIINSIKEKLSDVKLPQKHTVF